MRPGGRARPRTLRPNLTPMIDVVLQLIIFFMYTSQFAALSRTAVDLPEQPGQLENSAPEADLVIDLADDGGLSVAGERVDQARLAQIVSVESLRVGGADRLRVLVRADRGAVAAHLNTLALELRAAEVLRWRLGTADTGGGS
ncbi:MAG: biopolymer transporter ExbD [Planctomycetota bacterium]